MSLADDTLIHFSSSIASILPPDLWIRVDVHLSEESLPGILCVQPQMCVSPLLLRWRPKLDGVMPLAWRSFLCCSIVGSLVWSSSAQELIRCMRKYVMEDLLTGSSRAYSSALERYRPLSSLSSFWSILLPWCAIRFGQKVCRFR
jgi:hypothetical protein